MVDLWNSQTDKNGFFVVGGRGVENAQLNAESDNVMFREKWNHKPGQLKMENFILNGWYDTKAIVLI